MPAGYEITHSGPLPRIGYRIDCKVTEIALFYAMGWYSPAGAYPRNLSEDKVFCQGS